MAQPVWITNSGSLGVIPEGIFYQINLEATAPPSKTVFFKLLAGLLPPGIQVTSNGSITGVPKAVVSVQGVPTPVSRDITSSFAVRAYTTVNNQFDGTVLRLVDRTFTLTITGEDVPEFITPAGLVGTFYDGTEIAIQIEFTDDDFTDAVEVKLLSGSLPPGCVITKRGLITGGIIPLVGPPGTAQAGYDSTPKDVYPNDFTTRSASRSFQFTLEVTDGKNSNLRTFDIFVYSKDSMSADTTDFTADNTWLTADVIPTRTPVLLNPPGSLGIVRSDNYYAYKFEAIDFDGDAVEFVLTTGAGVGFDESPFDETGVGFDRGTFTLPPGLQIDPLTGWFYGYIPDQGATELSFRFAIQVRKIDRPEIISQFAYFTIGITGNVETDAYWITDPDLGIINNGATSILGVEAYNVGGRYLSYKLVQGSDSKLPQGLTLQPNGLITGKVSFNTFALDGGSTTFDVLRTTRLDPTQTTFDLEFNFTVNAFAPQTEQPGYEVTAIVVTNGGSGYTSQPTISITAPYGTTGSVAATAGLATIVGGVITGIQLGNPGRNYTSPGLVVISGGGGTGATAITEISDVRVTNAVSIFRRFSLTVNREFNVPYENLYIKAMPPLADRALISKLLQNQSIIPQDLLYRQADSNFGINKNIVYVHAYGLAPESTELYVEALQLNHYWKNLILGEFKTACARDANGNIIYEVVYSEIQDNLVNAQGISVSKKVTLPYPVNYNSNEVTEVWPNSLINMRDQVIDTVGQISPALPLWMTSKQQNNNVLGFVPAWVIAYVKPGAGNLVRYNISQTLGFTLNIIDFKADRYELDRSQTHNWNPETKKWIPHPPETTYFDEETTVFDGTSTEFNSPADRWTNTDEYDKYLVYPKANILG